MTTFRYETMRGSSPTTSFPVWILLLCLATTVFGVAGHGLWTPDEPRAAELVRSMAAPGASWLYPTLAGKPFVEKPPLFFWGAAVSMKNLGPLIGVEGAIRAASALSALLTVLVLWGTARCFLGSARGAAAAAALATSALFFQSGHWIVSDPVLALFVTAAVGLGAAGLERNRAALILAAYASVGAAFLAKGAVAFALIAPPAAALFFLYRRRSPGRGWIHPAGAVLAAAVILAWAVPFKLTGGAEAWKAWFWDNQVGRFLGRTPELGHLRGPFFYLALLPVVCLPWTPVLLGAIFDRGRRRETAAPGTPASRILIVALAWTLGGLLVLSAAGTKRDLYLLPLLPGAAVFVGAFAFRQPRWAGTSLLVLGWILVAAMAGAAVVRLEWTGVGMTVGAGFDPVAAAGALAAAAVLTRSRLGTMPRTAAAAAVFYIVAALVAFPIVDQAKNYKPGIETVLAELPAADAARVCAWDLDETSRGLLGFYGGVTLYDLHDENPLPDQIPALRRALAGEDARFDLMVAMEKREPFPPEGVELDPRRVRAEGRLGLRRRLLVLDCRPDTGKGPHDERSTP
ncbi:MAG TPA: glycosyltransferase family 39 protein [bacterium]|nr:glycosyltransferase family 39 protein [bacterium]HPQ67064.1 glycosyltransferase family 39 protein [bacterium]